MSDWSGGRRSSPLERALDGAIEPAEFTEEESPEELQITVRKEPRRSKVGIRAEREYHPLEFQIMSIGPWLVGQWNEDDPIETIMPGDTIFEVNGVSSSTEAMCNQFYNARVYKLCLPSSLPNAPASCRGANRRMQSAHAFLEVPLRAPFVNGC